MKNQYPHIYNYMYRLLENGLIKNFSNIFDYQKSEIIELFVAESDEEVEALSGEQAIPNELINKLLALNNTNADKVQRDFVKYFWSNASYILCKIFDAAENDYQKYNSRFGFDFSNEHLLVDNHERAAYVNQIFSSIFKL